MDAVARAHEIFPRAMFKSEQMHQLFGLTATLTGRLI